MANFQSFYKSRWIWFIEHMVIMTAAMIVLLLPSPMQTKPIQSMQDNKLMFINTIYLMAIFTLFYMTFVGLTFRVNPKGIGLTTDGFLPALKSILFPTFLIALIILVGKIIIPGAYVGTQFSLSLVLQYVFISVPTQEILFRGYCMWRCEQSWKYSWFIILFNSVYFAMFHMVLGNWWFVLGVFLLNIYWSYAFLKHRNLYVFMISHAILGTIYFLQ